MQPKKVGMPARMCELCVKSEVILRLMRVQLKKVGISIFCPLLRLRQLYFEYIVRRRHENGKLRQR